MSKTISKYIIVLLLLAALILLISFIADLVLRSLYPLKYEELVTEYSRQYEVDPALVYAVIKTESGFQPDAVSRNGAVGLMQITPDTYRWALMRHDGGKATDADLEMLSDPGQNIKYGVYILSLHLKEFQNTDTALCAYNAGRGIVKEWLSDQKYSADGVALDNIPYDETRTYVKKVNYAKQVYDKLYFERRNSHE